MVRFAPPPPSAAAQSKTLAIERDGWVLWVGLDGQGFWPSGPDLICIPMLCPVKKTHKPATGASWALRAQEAPGRVGKESASLSTESEKDSKSLSVFFDSFRTLLVHLPDVMSPFLS